MSKAILAHCFYYPGTLVECLCPLIHKEKWQMLPTEILNNMLRFDRVISILSSHCSTVGNGQTYWRPNDPIRKHRGTSCCGHSKDSPGWDSRDGGPSVLDQPWPTELSTKKGMSYLYHPNGSLHIWNTVSETEDLNLWLYFILIYLNLIIHPQLVARGNCVRVLC